MFIGTVWRRLQTCCRWYVSIARNPSLEACAAKNMQFRSNCGEKKTWRGKYIVRCTASDTETSILWWSNLQPLCKLRAKIALFTKRRLLLVKWKKNTEKMQLMKWNCGSYLDSDQHQIATKVNIFFQWFENAAPDVYQLKLQLNTKPEG